MVTGGAKEALVAIEEECYSTSDAKDSSCAEGHSSEKYTQSTTRLERRDHRVSLYGK